MARFATRNRDDACDIVQDAMLRLAERYAGHNEGDWGPLFFRILERRIIDWHRRARVRRALFSMFSPRAEDNDEGLDAYPDPRQATPERELIDAQATARLEHAITRLPLRQQQVFLLREMQGFDVRQTAEIMQCSAGSVKTHYFRARQALREQLEDSVD